MRRAVRSRPAPGALSALDAAGRAELDLARDWYEATPAFRKTYPFKAYRNDDVRRGLEAMFHGKCAYCESLYSSTAPMDIEHYRPKGPPEGDDGHPGYWWLAADWDNLLPSCIHCNRRSYQRVVHIGANLTALNLQASDDLHVMICGKHNAFPVGQVRAASGDANLTEEEAILLDPCRDDPDAHLVFTLGESGPISLVVPLGRPDADGATVLSRRGAVSIQVYGLNRLGLVQERTRILRRLEFLSGLVLQLDAVFREVQDEHSELAARIGPRLDFLIDSVIAEMRDMAKPTEPYSAMVRHWLRAFGSQAVNGIGVP